MLKSHDFKCNTCETQFDDLVDVPPREAHPPCPNCTSTKTEALLSMGVQMKTIQITHNKSKHLKAGYAHHFDNRPREKIGVSVPAQLKKD